MEMLCGNNSSLIHAHVEVYLEQPVRSDVEILFSERI